MTTIENFCRAWLATWTGNQPEKLIGFYTDDVYYRDPARPHGITGKQDLFVYFQKLLAKYPDWLWSIVETFPVKNGFILKWQAQKNSAAEKFFGLDIVELRDDKIMRNEVYFDPKFLLSSDS